MAVSLPCAGGPRSSADRSRSHPRRPGEPASSARLPLRVDNPAPADESASARVGTLSDRELAILRLLAVGHRNREIAAELFLSPHTVKFHVGNIFEKLGVRTRAEAAAVAFAAGLHPAPQPAAAAA